MTSIARFVICSVFVGFTPLGFLGAQTITPRDSGPAVAALQLLRDSLGAAAAIRDPQGATAETRSQVRAMASRLRIPLMTRAAWESCADSCRTGDNLLEVAAVEWRGDSALVAISYIRREPTATPGKLRVADGVQEFILLLRDSRWVVVGRGRGVRS